MQIRQEHDHFTVKEQPDVLFGDCFKFVLVPLTDQFAVQVIQCGGSLLFQLCIVCLLPDPKGHPADHQCDNEHDGEGYKVLRIAYSERKTGRHEEEIEGCNTQEGCQHCRPFGRPAGG